MRAWTFGKRIALGFAVAVLALGIVAVTGYRSVLDSQESFREVRHSLDVRAEIANLMSQLLNAETGQRGYVITGNDAFLEPYTGASEATVRSYERLRELTASNPVQQRKLEELKPALDSKLTQLKTVLDQRRTSFETASGSIAAGQGKQAMETVRRVIGEMDAEALRLLHEREQAAKSAGEVTTSVILWGSVGAIVLTILIGWFITSALTKQITSAVGNMQSSAAELQAAANQQASGASEQATAMSEIATTIRELLATSQQIAESAQRVATIANETVTTATSGTATVVRGNTAVATVRKQVDQLVTHMSDLSRRSQQIGAVLDIVAELAEQTNILAINATIEAAGAGDGGRRFGVVADEIRKLADRVASSTKEIREMVDGVRSAVNTAVMATETGSKAVDASASQVADMAASFNQIATLVDTTTDAAREIELSTKQQATAVEQVNIAIANIAQAAKETEASTSQTLSTASQLATLSREVQQLVQSDG
jgi:methyl-accepting chemotaxis protein